MTDKKFDVGESMDEASKVFSKTKDREEVLHIPLNKIGPNRKNPRKFFDQNSLNELAASIKEKGVIEPIIVRINNDPEYEFPYEIIAGERRWRASKIAGVETIRALVSEANDLDAETNAFIENFLREDLTFWETINTVASLRGKMETVDALVKAVCKPKRTIEAYLSYHKKFNLYDPLKSFFEENANKVDFSMAEMFSPIAEKMVAHFKKDAREFERFKKKAIKKGLREAIGAFAKKVKTPVNTLSPAPFPNVISMDIKETKKTTIVNLHIPKNIPITEEDIEGVISKIKETLLHEKDNKEVDIKIEEGQ